MAVAVDAGRPDRPYPVYRDSGVTWLGPIPKHWELRSLRSLTYSRRQRGAIELPLLSVVRERGVILRSSMSDEENHNFVPDDLSNYKIARAGDLVVNKMKAWQGSLGIAPCDGLASPAYFVFGIRNIERRFVQMLLRSKPYVAALAQASDGVRIGQWDLSPDGFKRIQVPIPPSAEQVAIVRFLDDVDRRVRRYIVAQRKLIALLHEQKTGIIERAVTRGTDPTVRLSCSGIASISEKPVHWAVKRLRYLVEGRLTYGANASGEYVNPDWPRYLRITDFDVDGALRSESFRSLPPEVAANYLVRPGDVLLARSGASVGKAFLVTGGTGLACHAGYLIRARPDVSAIEPEFLFAFMQSATFARWRDSTFVIATIQNIGADKYADLPVLVPPLVEQRAIMLFLKVATRDLTSGIVAARRKIALALEYHVSLIAAVVTGKLDVSDEAANLPQDVGVDPAVADGTLAADVDSVETLEPIDDENPE